MNLEKEEAEELVDLISEKAFIVTKDSYQTDKIRKDMDDKFLASALETGADYIVSGDNDLLELKHYHRIQIVDIRIFIKKVKINKI